MNQNNRFGATILARLSWKWLLLLPLLVAVLTAWLSINVASGRASTDKSKLDFGSVLIGQSANAQNITFTSDYYILRSFTLSIEGSNANDFSAEKSCQPLLNYPTCLISVSFKPSRGGSRTATLTLQYTDYGFFPHTENINLSGIGLDLAVQGRIYGQVTFKGKPLTNVAGVTVSLSGTSGGNPVKSGPQQVDSSGKYGFNNLAKGTYTVTLNIPTGVQIDGPPSYQVDMSQSVKDDQVNFNLTDPPPPTPLPTTPPSSKAENCEQNVAPVPGVVDMITCLQTNNSAGRSNLRYILRNNSSEAVDVNNSVKLALANGASLADAKATTGQFGGGVWNGFELAQGGIGVLELALDSSNGGLISNLTATVVGKTTKNLFSATISNFSSTSSLNRTTLAQVQPTTTPNCTPTSPKPGILDFVVCRAEVQPLANGNVKYLIKVIVNNGLSSKVDLGKTVEITVPGGVQIVSATADVGNTRTEQPANRVIWNGFTLEPNSSATLNLTIEAPPTQAGQPNTIIISDVAVTATDLSTGSKYEGHSGAISSTTPADRIPTKPNPGELPGLPSTGVQGVNDTDNLSTLLFLAALSLGCLFFVARLVLKKGQKK